MLLKLIYPKRETKKETGLAEREQFRKLATNLRFLSHARIIISRVV